MPFYPLNADSCTSSYCPDCISHKIISFRLSNSANICLLVCLNLVEGDSWCIPIEKNHTLKRKISVAIQCHWKELLYCFEKHNWLCILTLLRECTILCPSVSETVHLEIDVEIKLIMERFPYLLPSDTNFQSHYRQKRKAQVLDCYHTVQPTLLA